MSRSRQLAGRRVFFKRRGLGRLRSYWCRRWDNPPLRRMLDRPDEPKYRVEREVLGGALVILERLEFLWYRGLFSVGRHLESGRYIRDPVHMTLRGFGPRELVFPLALLDQLDALTLIGGWRRYQLAAGVEADERARFDRSSEAVAVRVDRVELATPPPLLTRWGPSTTAETLCLVGLALNTRLAGQPLVVPVREIQWRELAGYRERYLGK